jgi:Rod binding domain-containing protein
VARYAAGRRPAAGGDLERVRGDVAATREAARQLVGETFFGMLIRELRRSTSASHPLYGGRGEATLRPHLDQLLARRLATTRDFGLADAIVDRVYRDTPHSPLRSPSVGRPARRERS